MSYEKGELLIGNVPGLAMAASEVSTRPVPSVEEPEGADIPTKEEVRLTADNLLNRHNSLKTTAITRLFLEPYAQRK